MVRSGASIQQVLGNRGSAMTRRLSKHIERQDKKGHPHKAMPPAFGMLNGFRMDTAHFKTETPQQDACRQGLNHTVETESTKAILPAATPDQRATPASSTL